MENLQNRVITCDNCGFEFPGNEKDKRYPCPECGCKIRNIKIEINETVRIYDSLGLKLKNPQKTGKSKIRVESFSGYQNSNNKKKMVKKERRIDREKDEYYEKVIDPESGEIIHECSEKLSDHIGHGSAKSYSKDL